MSRKSINFESENAKISFIVISFATRYVPHFLWQYGEQIILAKIFFRIYVRSKF